MMNTDGDELVRLLGSVEWDEQIQAMQQDFELQKVKIAKDMYSTDVPSTALQYEKLDINDFYFNQVSFEEKCNIALPFGLQKGDSREECFKKITLKTKPMKRYRYPNIEDKNKQYFLSISFTEGLVNIVAYTRDTKENYEDLDECIAAAS